MTITLHWWMIPTLLVVVALGLWYHGSKETGMFGGYWQFLVGCGLLIGAIAAALVGLVK